MEVARALVDTLGEEIAQEVEIFHSNVGEVKAEVLLNNVASRKGGVRVSRLADKLTKLKAKAISDTLAERVSNLDIKTSDVEAYKVINTLDDTLVNKAIDTLRDSQATKDKGLYYSKHTCNKKSKWSARCNRLQAKTGNTRAYRRVVKEVETHGNTSLR